MTQCNEIKLPKGIDYELLNEARIAKNLTFDDLESLTQVPKDTVKNILTGKTKNPGVENLNPICIVLGVSIQKVLRQEEKTAIENQGIKNENAAVLALKEIYETQMAAAKATSEAHIANIRAHYEQHHKDLTDNFEKRLADKREIIELLKEENKELYWHPRWCSSYFKCCSRIFSPTRHDVFSCCLVSNRTRFLKQDVKVFLLCAHNILFIAFIKYWLYSCCCC